MNMESCIPSKNNHGTIISIMWATRKAIYSNIHGDIWCQPWSLIESEDRTRQRPEASTVTHILNQNHNHTMYNINTYIYIYTYLCVYIYIQCTHFFIYDTYTIYFTLDFPRPDFWKVLDERGGLLGRGNHPHRLRGKCWYLKHPQWETYYIYIWICETHRWILMDTYMCMYIYIYLQPQ